MSRRPAHRWLLWGAMVAALGASWSHVLRAFGQLERSGPPAWLDALGPFSAVLAAVGLDLGMLALAWALAARRRLRQPSRDLWITVAAFAVLSAYANADAALGVILGEAPTLPAVAALDGWTLARVLVLAGALPLLALALGRTVEADAELDAAQIQAQPVAEEPATVAPAPRRRAAEPRRARRRPSMGEATAGS